jgi:hypothetical protein
MDYDRAMVHGSMVDHGRRQAKGSPGCGLGAAPVSISSLALGEKEEEASGVPTVGEGGRCGAGGRPATGMSWRWRFALDDKRLGAGRDEGWSGFERGGEWLRRRGLL